MKYLYQEGFTQNREISWLRFNERVLEEAADLSVPPLERLRFIAIFQSNLEEFYRVRVGSLMAQKASGDTTPDIRSGWTPSRQLEEISRELAPVLRRRDLLYTQTIEALAASGIRHARAEDLTREERRRFARQLLQGPERLKPVILHGFRELPEPETGKVCQISLLPSDSGLYIGFLPVPEDLPSYSVLESGEQGIRIIQTAELLRAVVPELYVPFEPSASCLIRIERSAEFPDVDEDDLPADSKLRMKTLLKGRAAQHAVLLETDLPLPDMAAEALSDRFGIPEEQITCAGSLLGLDYAYALEKDLPEGIRKQVCFRPHQPRNRYPETDGRMMDLVRRRDLLLSFPYDSFEPLIRLLEEAAEDPQAREIRICIYRLASGSRIAAALCRAARQGKKVHVMMELRARFDEENNLRWTELLQQAGCRVECGSRARDSYKVHCKLCQIVLETMGEKRWITYIGTGNFNEKTAAQYTDLGLLTYDPEIGREAGRFFRDLVRGRFDGQYSHILAAPSELKTKLLALIGRETAKCGRGRIFLKINSLTDAEIIDALAEASQAGVRIRMIVRGICCMLPDIPMRTEQVEIVNVVGRFLEHSRVYVFGSGADEVMYLSSADLMTRNTERRAELACPVYDPEIRKEIRHILRLNFHDTVKGRRLNAEGVYEGKKKQAVRLDSQLALKQCR